MNSDPVFFYIYYRLPNAPMKKIAAFLLCCIFAATKVHAQVTFCPAGAEWTAYYHMFAPFHPSYLKKIAYAGDSLLEQQVVKKLVYTNFYYDCNITGPQVAVIRQNGDTVFIRNAQTQNKWEVLFNYAAGPGDQWTITFLTTKNTVRTHTITVDSTSQTTENNVTLQRLFVKHSQFGPQVITERYGWGYLFAFNRNTCPYSDSNWFGDNLCYKDDTFGTKYFSSLSCDYQNPVGSTAQNLKAGFDLIPNPSQGTDVELLIHSSVVPPFFVNVMSTTGSLIESLRFEAPRVMIPARCYASGVYFITVVKDYTIISTGKLMITD
jgi:hypothetical protein